MDESLSEQLSVVLGRMDSALQTIALRRSSVQQAAKLIIGGTPFTIPAGTKSFNVINLGLNGLGVTFEDIPITGVTGITAIPKQLDTFAYSIENDMNYFETAMEISPVDDHHVFVQYIIQ